MLGCFLFKIGLGKIGKMRLNFLLHLAHKTRKSHIANRSFVYLFEPAFSTHLLIIPLQPILYHDIPMQSV